MMSLFTKQEYSATMRIQSVKCPSSFELSFLAPSTLSARMRREAYIYDVDWGAEVAGCVASCQ
jgi:hypothetical protein